jgi:three-Cys-motif partner protein
MALELVRDAISLSGLTGSKLKCEIIGEYYRFWWNITSGGARANYDWPTAIVELDAATGEVYIKDTKETILGSSGHALDLKCSDPKTRRLKVILVEKDADCYNHLKRVISRRWSNVNINLAEGPIHRNTSNIYLLNVDLDRALDTIGRIKLGNALFFFDPLRSVEYQAIGKVAGNRMKTYYRKGTEFIVFLFTSDWFLGRDDFAGVPTTVDETNWSTEEKRTAAEADALFGDTEWRSEIVNSNPIYERENRLVEVYRNRLHKWFRYVLPMPFNPKANQIFHLILCSNFEIGVRATRNFFCGKTDNPEYRPDNKVAFGRFRNLHQEVLEGLSGNRRPKQWLTLWRIIAGHEEGICDCMCSDLEDIEESDEKRKELLEWLEHNEYLTRYDNDNAWELPIIQYKLNWATIKSRLGVDPPPPLKPLSLKPLSLKEISQ